MKVSVHAAKTNLSKLIEAALAGEEVIIARGVKPVVRLVPVQQKRFAVGLLGGKVPPGGPDFLEPMGEEEIAAWEGR
jgi:prevent-host-death family protein